MWFPKIAHQLLLHRALLTEGVSALLVYLIWLWRSSAIVAEGRPLHAFRQRMHFIYSGWRHQDVLRPFHSTEGDAPCRRLAVARPNILDAVVRPYQSTHWDVRTRLTKLRTHYETMADLRWLFDPQAGVEVEICTLPAIHPRLRLVLDEAIWFRNEGPLVLSLFLGPDRIFSLAFALRREEGALIAYVGAVQGRNPADLPGVTGTYRALTKAACGMRPRDLLIELFRMLCDSLGAVRILLVSDKYQQHRDVYFGCSRDAVYARYDAVWLERGAVRIDETMFELPVRVQLRTADQMPPRKRGLYRRRYAMLAEIHDVMMANLDERTPDGADARWWRCSRGRVRHAVGSA